MQFEKLIKIQPEKANFLLENFLPIPQNAVTLLSASGGTGKTRLSLIMADRYIKAHNKNVALWLTEDYKGQVRHIFDDMVKAKLVSFESMEKMLIILDAPPQLAIRDKGVFKANYKEINAIGETFILNDVGFAVFDPLLAFYGGNENDNSEARVFIQSFAEWARTAQITTLIIHHANKDGASRGATAFHDGVRARYEMSYFTDKNGKVDEELKRQGIRKIQIKKDNWGISIPFHRLTNGEDSIGLKIAPVVHTFMSEPVKEVEFQNIEMPDLGF